MSVVASTHTWGRTLAPHLSDEPIAFAGRTQLRNAFEDFRKNVSFVASFIPKDLKDFTVHDISHIDALWEMTDLVIGTDYLLTPAEAFILGCAFLVHDLGLALAADPDGLESLKATPQWTLAVRTAYIGIYGREPQSVEDAEADDSVLQIAVPTLLRSLHAERAALIPLNEYLDEASGQHVHLLPDAELRISYGELIGEIAYSHWWSIEKIQQRFMAVLGAPATHPQEWKIDPLKLALIIRVADACHLDSRRAPVLLRLFQQPQGKSKLHWIFQERMQKPYRDGRALIYSSARSFSIDEADAWWLCFDTLRQADRELTRSNATLRDTGRPEFQIDRIAGTEDPVRLQRHVPAAGWQPIDAKIHVGSVARLVTTLGGEALYGDSAVAPLRELIQNAADAVRAKRLQDGAGPESGKIVVRLREVDGCLWLDVEDDGLGMSERVLREVLLDFGQSYWTSELILEERPDLIEKGYKPSGKYGIGFFSVFMLGDDVEIITRTAEDSVLETRVLSMTQGAEGRPMLRPAKPAERLRSPGTKISIKLKSKKINEQFLGPGTIGSGSRYGASIRLEEPWGLEVLCAWLCPCLDTNLYTSLNFEPLKQSVRANDWKDMDAFELLLRIMPLARNAPGDFLQRQAQRLKPVVSSSGELVGRASISISEEEMMFYDYGSLSVLTAGFFRSTGIDHMAGVFLGKPTNAARDQADLLLAPDEMVLWISDRLKEFEIESLDAQDRLEYADIIRSYGIRVGSLPIVKYSQGVMNYDELVKWARSFTEINSVSEHVWDTRRRHHPADQLRSNVLLVEDSAFRDPLGQPSKAIRDLRALSSSNQWRFRCNSLMGLIWEAIAEAWQCSIDELISSAVFLNYSNEAINVSEGPSGLYKSTGVVYSKTK